MTLKSEALENALYRLKERDNSLYDPLERQKIVRAIDDLLCLPAAVQADLYDLIRHHDGPAPRACVAAGSGDARYELASRLAADIRDKAEQLSTAIYEASKYGYAAKVAVRNAQEVAPGVFLGTDKPAAVVQATIPFDIGGAVG